MAVAEDEMVRSWGHSWSDDCQIFPRAISLEEIPALAEVIPLAKTLDEDTTRSYPLSKFALTCWHNKYHIETWIPRKSE